MYVIIDETTNRVYKTTGSFPINALEKLIKNNHKIVVVSTYSHTLKYDFKWHEMQYGGDYEGIDENRKEFKYCI